MDNHNTYRIRITNLTHVQVEKFDPDHQLLGEPQGTFRFDEDKQKRILALHNQAISGKLTGSEAANLGELLFEALFDDRLRYDFFSFYEQSRNDGRILRIELDVDQLTLPQIAALPWEFLRIASDSDFGTMTLSTVPDMVFSRRRSHWRTLSSFQLEPLEYLRVVLAVAAPEGLGPVQFDKVKSAIEESARTEPVEFSTFIEHANRKKIDEAYPL